MLVYPKPGAKVSSTDIGIIVYGNVPGAVPIEIVNATTHVDTLPTAVPSPLPGPTATPPAGMKTWGPLFAAEIRPILPAATYAVDATVTRYSCPPGQTTHQVQVQIGTFKLAPPR